MRTYAPAAAEAVLDALLEEPSLARGVVHHAVCPPARPSRPVPGLAGSADPDGARRPAASTRSTRHQAEALEAVHAGEDVVRRHADGLGQEPVLRAARPPGARRGSGGAGALPLPDQGARPGPGRGVRASSPRAAGLAVAAATYDGDTPAPIRSAIRTAGQVVVTNPDMLHAAILPHHTKWFQLFEQLRVIVIDELHTYRGVFGSHVANVLRRLLRLCAPLRLPPGHRLLLGHDREPGRAGDPPDRARRRVLVDRNGAPSGRAARPARRPAGARCRHRARGAPR